MHEFINQDLLTLTAMMLLTGAVGGVLAGLLGVGGGIVIAPVLDLVLASIGVDPSVRMHVAVATSLATIIPTAISSSRAHHAKGAVDMAQLKRWSIAIFLGAIVGVLIASRVTGDVLSAVFGVIALLVAIKMLLPLEGKHIAQTIPGGPGGQLLPFAIGGLSSMMGIGGGTLGVPILSMFGAPIRSAVATASAFGLIISIPATIGFVLGGWNDPLTPPWSLGYVNLIGFALIAPSSILATPWGVHLAHTIPPLWLKRAFAVFLAITSLRMFWKLFT